MKTCSKCGEDRPLDEFGLDGRRKDGIGIVCGECKRAVDRAKSKRWRDRNPDRVKARNDAFRAANPGYQLAWYHEHSDSERPRRRAATKRFREARPETAREHRQKYRETHRDRVAQTEREKTYSRRLKMPYSPEMAVLMAELVLRPCAYCGSTEKITIDHIEPLARGGKHEASNLAPACLSCNSSKGAKPLAQWLEERAI